MIHCFQISFIRSFSQFFFLLKGRRKRKSDKLLLWIRKAANSWKNVSLGTHLDIWSPIFGYRPPPFSICNDTSELIAKGPRLARCSIVDSEQRWHFFSGLNFSILSLSRLHERYPWSETFLILRTVNVLG